MPILLLNRSRTAAAFFVVALVCVPAALFSAEPSTKPSVKLEQLQHKLDAISETLKNDMPYNAILIAIDKASTLFWTDVMSRGPDAVTDWLHIAHDSSNSTRSCLAVMAEPDIFLMPIGGYLISEKDAQNLRSLEYRKLVHELQLLAARTQLEMFRKNPEELRRYCRIVLWNGVLVSVGDPVSSLQSRMEQFHDALQNAPAEESAWHIRNALLLLEFIGEEHPIELIEAPQNARDRLAQSMLERLNGGAAQRFLPSDKAGGIWRIEENRLPVPPGDWPVADWPKMMPSARAVAPQRNWEFKETNGVIKTLLEKLVDGKARWN